MTPDVFSVEKSANGERAPRLSLAWVQIPGLAHSMSHRLLSSGLRNLTYRDLIQLLLTEFGVDLDVGRFQRASTLGRGLQITSSPYDPGEAGFPAPLDDRSSLISRLVQELRRERGGAAQLQLGVSAIRESPSWRITKPLRSLGHLLRMRHLVSKRRSRR